MAIGGNGVQVEGELRNQFDTSMNSQAFATEVGESLGSLPNNTAAIGYGFVGNFHGAISDYIKEINGKIDDMETNCTDMVQAAFKGTNVEYSIKELITKVKQEAQAYAQALQAAEKQVISEVSKAYRDYDQNLGEDIKAASAKLTAGDTTNATPPPGGNGGQPTP